MRVVRTGEDGRHRGIAAQTPYGADRPYAARTAIVIVGRRPNGRTTPGFEAMISRTALDRPRAFGEIARVVRPGGYVVVGYKQGDDSPRRGGRQVGVEFDIYWYSPEEVEKRITDAGFVR